MDGWFLKNGSVQRIEFVELQKDNWVQVLGKSDFIRGSFHQNTKQKNKKLTDTGFLYWF